MNPNPGPPPRTCPVCGDVNNFTPKGMHFDYDQRAQGTGDPEQVPRHRVTIWECDDCKVLIHVRSPL